MVHESVTQEELEAATGEHVHGLKLLDTSPCWSSPSWPSQRKISLAAADVERGSVPADVVEPVAVDEPKNCLCG